LSVDFNGCLTRVKQPLNVLNASCPLIVGKLKQRTEMLLKIQKSLEFTLIVNVVFIYLLTLFGRLLLVSALHLR